ncbi:AraC family transcriptional regulator [Acidisoma silvae]|uniref:AraC family transcriptional regulator n=1 Tax=Acidisoma silvae TaxID=2802396 RepID=A0A963YTQ6_9PROT|nr:AraC family transcriptional regulator [Acidisoma silvae]MCB8876880.1 AraC family transcriptional regulator [Acidisoma silvae]
MSQPELEIIMVDEGEPFKIWAHGYPFRTVRWHFHPEFEIHLITATSGRVFVGDYIGSFLPGNLIMTGPNLPHNWLSDVAPDVTIPERCIVLQFGAAFIRACADIFPGLDLSRLIEECGRGLEFSGDASDHVGPLLQRMLTTDRLSRPALFLQILEGLLRDKGRRMLASVGYLVQPHSYMTQPLNPVLDHIARNLDSDLHETELAALSGYSPGAFSRAFHRQTGMTFTAYVNGLRINRACMFLTTTNRLVTDICYDVGFNNVSNFNRRFQTVTGMTPRDYRNRHRENDRLPHQRDEADKPGHLRVVRGSDA